MSQSLDKNSIEQNECITSYFLNADLKINSYFLSLNMLASKVLNIFMEEKITPF
jgi:hypothetical protein